MQRGIACLVRSAVVVGLTGATPDRDAVWFTRILGGREVIQGALTVARPTRTVLTAGMAVDLLHALSLLALAAVDARRRRPALLNTSTATAWRCSAELWSSRPGRGGAGRVTILSGFALVRLTGLSCPGRPVAR